MKKLITSAALSLMLLPLMAQQEGMSSSPEEMEKKLVEYIEKEVEKYSAALSLEYWQEFYADSTFNHNLHAMQDELNELKSIVSDKMVNALPLSVPVVVEINTGSNWLEAH